MKNLLIALSIATFFLGLDTAYAADCATSAGHVTTPAVGSTTSCTVAATQFDVTIYEIGLCTSSTLTAPTSSVAYSTSSCQVIYSNAAGEQITAANAGALQAGTRNIPAAGSYANGYVIFGKSINVTGSVTFDNSVTVVGGTAGAGTTCYTNGLSKAASAINLLSPTGLPFTCGVGSATAATFTIDNLALGSTLTPTMLLDHTVLSSLGSDSVNVYLLAPSPNAGKLATATGSGVDKILAVQTFATPVTINSSSASLDIGFTKSTGLGVSMVTSVGPTRNVTIYPAIPNIKISGH